MGRPPKKKTQESVETAITLNLETASDADIKRVAEQLKTWQAEKGKRDRELQLSEFREKLEAGSKIEFSVGKGKSREIFVGIVDKILKDKLRVRLADSQFPTPVRYEQVSRIL